MEQKLSSTHSIIQEIKQEHTRSKASILQMKTKIDKIRAGERKMKKDLSSIGDSTEQIKFTLQVVTLVLLFVCLCICCQCH